MRTINGFTAEEGTVIRLRVLGVGEGVTTFAAVLKRFGLGSDGAVVAKWNAAQLLKGGGTAQLGSEHGDNVIVLPVSSLDSGEDAVMEVELEAFGPTPFHDRQKVPVSSNEPFGWRIVIE
ncbi:MAG TPA: hypothetical protein VI172_04990 [Candidatus Dormibacteraeota bacterium]|jgi:hypothetical protein